MRALSLALLGSESYYGSLACMLSKASLDGGTITDPSNDNEEVAYIEVLGEDLGLINRETNEEAIRAFWDRVVSNQIQIGAGELARLGKVLNAKISMLYASIVDEHIMLEHGGQVGASAGSTLGVWLAHWRRCS